ncbi:MAG TPA: glucose 1-dehydrogenase [Polyangiales bacterium]|jgi:NAD(P)-dependent dehydrogenase (short-subunit alcohol dehydrogenase family)|nr:glucose 1-dehydrogenase [Polyangiales bacterium]
MTSDKEVVLITGAGQGIGKGIARVLCDAGKRVCLAELDEEAGRSAAEELGGDSFFVQLDVSDEASVQRALSACISRFGRLDGLVNNAGIAAPGSTPVEQLELSVWNRMLGTNLTGAFLCTKHAVPALRKTQGAIVNIASSRALQSEPNTEAYAASKGGIVALTHALAMSLGPAVRVNCISPGWIDVSEWKKPSQRKAAKLSEKDHAQHPVGRVGNPLDIGKLALYLLSDDSGFVTGQNFVVDGGMTRKMIYEE